MSHMNAHIHTHIGYTYYKIERTFQDGCYPDAEPKDCNLTKELFVFSTIEEVVDYLVEYENLPRNPANVGLYHCVDGDELGVTIDVLYYIFPVKKYNKTCPNVISKGEDVLPGETIHSLISPW